MVLTKRFSPETFARSLESWSWLDLAGKVPVLASLFGDVFLQDQTGYWFLDSIEGSLSFVVPPVLGGKFDPDNVTVRDFVVALNISGQIHDQIRDLPPGTPIKGFTVDGRTP